MKKKFKKIVAANIAVMLVFQIPVAAKEVEKFDQGQVKEYIVVTENEGVKEKLLNQYHASEMSKESNIRLCSLTEDMAENLKKEKGIDSVEENIIIRGSGNQEQNDDKTTEQVEWNIKMVNGDSEKMSEVQPGEKIKVALIDSGVNYNSSLEVKQRKNLVEGEDDMSILFEDATGHGTAIAGVIAGKRKEGCAIGINHNVELYSIRALDEKNTASLDKIIEAIYQAIAYDVDIINMSFGTCSYSNALKTAIDDAVSAGILLVAAAGNRGDSDGIVEYPAAFDNVLSVGSVDHNGIISETSSTEGNVDVVAPGELVRSTAIFDGSMVCSGTSMATPHVTGVASVLWQKDTDRTADFISGLIKKSAHKAGTAEVYGDGIVDLDYALEIYDEYAYEYDNHKAISDYDNNKELHTTDDVDYVEGSWKRSDHEATISQSSSAKDYKGNSYTKRALDLLIAGIRLPDKEQNMKYNKNTTNENPWWHAGITSTRYGMCPVNYISCMVFVNRLIQTANCDISKSQQLTGMTYYTYQSMKNDLQADYVDDEIGSSGYSINDKNRRYMYWGILMHIITDAFAHRAYVKSANGNYVHINNAGYDTDTITDIPERYHSACQVVKKIMSDCIDVEEPIHSKLISANQLGLSNSYYTGNFKMQNLYDFVEEAGVQGDASTSTLNRIKNVTYTYKFYKAVMY